MEGGEIIIKDIDVLRGLMERNYHPLLINIILEVANKYGLVITESYREKKHRNDLHGTNPVRAMDIRTWIYPKWQAKEISKYINRLWQYDQNRENMRVAIIHKVNGGAEHMHIQTSYKTRRRALHY